MRNVRVTDIYVKLCSFAMHRPKMHNFFFVVAAGRKRKMTFTLLGFLSYLFFHWTSSMFNAQCSCSWSLSLPFSLSLSPLFIYVSMVIYLFNPATRSVHSVTIHNKLMQFFSRNPIEPWRPCRINWICEIRWPGYLAGGVCFFSLFILLYLCAPTSSIQYCIYLVYIINSVNVIHLPQ